MRFLRFGTELRRFGRNRMTRAAIVVACLIPLLYGALYLWAFWNPTDHLDQLPVAIVNADTGAKTSDGKAIHAGDQITDNLVDSHKLGWTQTSATDAAQGLDAGRYYAVLTIPAHFSEAVATAGTNDPVRAPLQVTYDDANGYTARTILSSVFREVRASVSATLGENMVDKLLVGYGDIHAGVLKASNGANDLAGGATKAHDGAGKLASGAGQLAAGADKLADGIGDAHTGAQTLASGAGQLQAGATKLSDGANQLAAGADKLATGLPAAQDASRRLADGSAQLASGANQAASSSTTLASGARQVADGAGKLADGIAAAPAAAQKLAAGADQVADALGTVDATVQRLTAPAEALASQAGKVTSVAQQASSDADDLASALASAAKTNPELQPYADKAARVASRTDQVSAVASRLDSAKLSSAVTQASGRVHQLATGARQVADGNRQLADKLTAAVPATRQLAAGAGKVADGADQLSAGIGRLSGAATQISDGNAKLADGLTDAVTGSRQLGSGARTLAQGNQTLAGKLGEAASGASRLADGLQTAQTGAASLATNTHKLADGATSLNSGLSSLDSGAHQLAKGLKDAVGSIPTWSADDQKANADMMSNPVSLDSQFVHEASGNGEGFAPYFIGLALYVGAMIMWMLLRPLSQRSLAAPVSATRVVLSNLLPAAVLGGVQVGLLLSTLVLGLGLTPTHPIAMFAFGMLVSLGFVALQQTLNVWLGTSVGRLATLVLLMLQLTSAGGTYPAATSPEFFQVLHRFLPMTQVVNGLREAITGDLNPLFAGAVSYFVVMIVASLLLSAWGAARARVWTMTRLHPAVSL